MVILYTLGKVNCVVSVNHFASDDKIGYNPHVRIFKLSEFRVVSKYRYLVIKVQSNRNKKAAAERKALWGTRVCKVHKRCRLKNR